MFLDEDAPQEIQQDRPPGYVTLVLLYGEPARTLYVFHYDVRTL